MNETPNVGYAEIAADGVLTLHLIGTGGGGEIAHAIKSYKPGDPYYEEADYGDSALNYTFNWWALRWAQGGRGGLS